MISSNNVDKMMTLVPILHPDRSTAADAVDGHRGAGGDLVDAQLKMVGLHLVVYIIYAR